MHFHLRWSGPVGGFDHGGYHIGEDRYGSLGQQQDKRGSRQENWIVQNTKLDHPISLKTT
jgi:hypothetical protein